MVTLSMFHSEDPEKLGATVQNLVGLATWCPGFVHICSNFIFISQK
jgi:hypothetical protein